MFYHEEPKTAEKTRDLSSTSKKELKGEFNFPIIPILIKPLKKRTTKFVDENKENSEPFTKQVIFHSKTS